jgi:fructose-bisphosphate aldolase, class II
MPFVSYAELLQDARARHYAIGGFNVFAMEFLPAILSCAAEEKAPVLLQINPIHFYLSDLPNYLIYIKSQIAQSPVPVGLHLDHGISLEIIKYGLQAGFPAVMYDGSRLPFRDNLANAKAVKALCTPMQVLVEAELGCLNDEGLELNQQNRDRLFTDPQIAQQFVFETNVDALAVSIGNAHGFYKGDPQLDFTRLEQIRQAVAVPLVLHGGSGIPDADLQKAIGLGIHKINIYTEMSAAGYGKMRELSCQQEYQDYPSMLYQSRLAVKEIVRQKLRVFGSCSKA